MYYTRHTQVNLRNPLHNDYLRYHPRIPPSPHDIAYPDSQYRHFIPEMTAFGEKWTQVYTLGDEIVKCELQRTEHPYVYSLKSQDDRVQDGEIGKKLSSLQFSILYIITSSLCSICSICSTCSTCSISQSYDT